MHNMAYLQDRSSNMYHMYFECFHEHILPKHYYGYYPYIMENDEMLAYVINKMRKIRISKGMSQMELCLRANMSQSFLGV